MGEFRLAHSACLRRGMEVTVGAGGLARLPHGVCVVRSNRMEEGKSRLLYSLGVARETTGARRMALSLLRVPPGGAAHPHHHLAGETLIYVLQGRAETRFGDGLSQSVAAAPGETLFIPAGVPHAPRNLSSTDAALALSARTDPAQQEPLMPLDVAAGAHPASDPRSVQKLGENSAQPRHLALWRLVLGPRSAHPPEQYAAAEIAVYVGTEGVDLGFGGDLAQSAVLLPGDFVYLPDGVRHQWRNSAPREAWLVVARSTSEPLATSS